MNCYDRKGNAITFELFSRLWSDDNNRVALTEFDDGSSVSTVWLGMNHQFDDNREPLIFETMVFSQAQGESELCWRYSTEEEALAGHEKIVLDWMKNRETARTDL